MDTTRAVCSCFGERADAAASLCVHRSRFVGHPRSDTASMWQSPTPACTAILRNCLIDNKFQFRSSAKNPGRSAPTICENVPAVASQQAATGYGILSETSGLGFSRTRLSVILRILARWTRSSIREGCAATKFDRGGPGNSQNGEPFGLASAEPAGCPHQGASLPSSSVASAPISRQSSASGPAPNHLPQAIAIACGSAPAVPTGSRLRPDVVGRIGPGRPG
jgi:hypothetical protein